MSSSTSLGFASPRLRRRPYLPAFGLGLACLFVFLLPPGASYFTAVSSTLDTRFLPASLLLLRPAAAAAIVVIFDVACRMMTELGREAGSYTKTGGGALWCVMRPRVAFGYEGSGVLLAPFILKAERTK